jgi:hypothetical protein
MREREREGERERGVTHLVLTECSLCRDEEKKRRKMIKAQAVQTSTHRVHDNTDSVL